MKTKLKELRTAAGLTQQQLADRTHVSAGRSSPSKKNNTALADVGIPAGTGVRRPWRNCAVLRKNKSMEDAVYEKPVNI